MPTKIGDGGGRRRPLSRGMAKAKREETAQVPAVSSGGDQRGGHGSGIGPNVGDRNSLDDAAMQIPGKHEVSFLRTNGDEVIAALRYLAREGAVRAWVERVCAAGLRACQSTPGHHRVKVLKNELLGYKYATGAREARAERHRRIERDAAH